MSNLEKVNEMLMKDPETAKKLAEEMKRLAESKEAADVKEAMAKGVKAVFGIELTDEELEAALAKPETSEEASAKTEKLDLDALDQVAGGITMEEAKRAGKHSLTILAIAGETFADMVEASVSGVLGNPLGIVGDVSRRFIKTAEKYKDDFKEMVDDLKKD